MNMKKIFKKEGGVTITEKMVRSSLSWTLNDKINAQLIR